MAVQKILKEDTTSAVEISEEDVSLYAEQLGIDVTKEKNLLWIAKKGLETPVPKPWCPVEDEKGRIYYYNQVTDKSSWEHPADEHFRKLVKQERDKNIASKEDTELGIESELSSLDDVPPITSGKNSISAQMDESNLRSSSRRIGSLSKLHELGREEKFDGASYLKRSATEDEFQKNNGGKNTRKRNTLRNDPLIKVTTESSLNHSTDDELSTGLDGIGFDRFAEQYGIMDASRLSPVMPPSQMALKSQPMPKNLLKTLFSTSKGLDRSSSEERKNEEPSFADFLKEAEEYSNKSLSRDKSQYGISSDENHSEENHSKILSNGSAIDNGTKEDSEHEGIKANQKRSDTIASDNESFMRNLLIIEDHWKRKLDEKENELRLDHEKKIVELKRKLEEERNTEEKKLNDSILLMKEENSVILAKQEQVLTEELEADLESAKEEIEMKRLATLQAIQEQEEIYTKELEEKKNDVVQQFELKIQELYSEMETKLEEKKQEIEESHLQEIEKLNQQHAKHLEELKNDFETEKELEEKKQEMEKNHQDEIDNLNKENAKHLEELRMEFEQKMEKELEEKKQEIEKNYQEEINTLNKENSKHLEELRVDMQQKMEKELEERKQEIERIHQEEIDNLNKENSKLLEELRMGNQQKNDLEFPEEISALKEELTSLKEQIESEKQALQQLQESKIALEEQIVHLKHTLEQLEEEKGAVEEQIENEKQAVEKLQEERDIVREEVETGKQALEKLQEEKLCIEEEKARMAELLYEEERMKNDNEEGRNKLLEEKNVLQSEIIELKNELSKQSEALESVEMNKSTLEAEVHLIKEELNKQASLLQQAKEVLPSSYANKYTDTFDLSIINHNISEKSQLDIDCLPENQPASAGDRATNSDEIEKIQFEDDKKHELGDTFSADKNGKMPVKEDKMERLEIKIDALEKAFRLLERKIGSTLDSTLFHSDKTHCDNTSRVSKTEEKHECCDKTIHANFTSGLTNNVEQLFNSEELKHSPNLQSTPNKYSVFCMPNAKDTQPYENNLLYNVYSRDIALSPLYVAGKDIELFPFPKSDAALQLEQCKEKFRNLQAKREISQLNIELLKKDILSDISRKDADGNNKVQNLSYQQTHSPVYTPSHLESQYTENILPTPGINNIVTFPTKSVQNSDWNSMLWQDAQKYIEKEEELNSKNYSYDLIEEQRNNPLDQFFALTETVLDKELELVATDKNKKHYFSYPTLNGRNSSNTLIGSFGRLNDSHTKDVTYSGLSTNYKPMYLNQQSLFGEVITDKEDWMEKLGNMYQRIRSYERDLTLRCSSKSNI